MALGVAAGGALLAALRLHSWVMRNSAATHPVAEKKA